MIRLEDTFVLHKPYAKEPQLDGRLISSKSTASIGFQIDLFVVLSSFRFKSRSQLPYPSENEGEFSL
ncbi:hypothetical protein NC651_021447 [Populus alba x Populus x berolinensis]|nr:hypothetical protein NC651_021447 [Populus alba x Populus x berolinensis]